MKWLLDKGKRDDARIAVEGGSFTMFKRVALRLAVLAGLMLTSPVLAHENHEELGAGPGPAVEQNVVAAEKAEAVDMHSEMAAEHGEAMGQHMEAAEENKTFGQQIGRASGRERGW